MLFALLVRNSKNRILTYTYLLSPRWQSSIASSRASKSPVPPPQPPPLNDVPKSSASPACDTHPDLQIKNPPIISSIPSSPHHSSLSEFLLYANRVSLSTSSTTYVGTYYEYLCLASLAQLGFTLTRIGGRSDAGIDLLGTWNLPSTPAALRCIVQCKALRAKVTPNLVRELEGAFAGVPPGWRRDNVVGVLCAPREATKGVRDAVRAAGRGVVWIMVDGIGASEGTVRQILWNEKAAHEGLMGLNVQIRYISNEMVGQEGVEKEVVLTWKGQVWNPRLKVPGSSSRCSQKMDAGNDSHVQSMAIISKE